MHTHIAHRSASVATLTVRLVAVALVCALSGSLVFPPVAGASDGGDSGVRVVMSPEHNDSYRGWTTRLTTVCIVPTSPGRIYYTWDSPLGGWKPYEGALIVPEGKRELHAVLVAEDGSSSTVWTGEVKVDYRAHTRSIPSSATAALTGVQAQVTVSVRINPWTGTRIIRLGGADRYETSALISARNFPTADTVIIATGEKFADALSSSGLAGCTEGPVLLTRRAGLPATVSNEIRRLGASTAIIVGGVDAVSPTVAGQLYALGLSVQRIGGATRYETAAMIGTRVVSYGQYGGRVFIARGDDFADALALGPLAYSARAPLLLVTPNTVPSATRSFLGANPISSGCIAGGTVAVSEGVVVELSRYVPGLVRIAGTSRYSTATAIATWAEENGLCTFETVGMATGTNFADALCGGVAAGANGGIILLTKPDELPDPTVDWITLNVGDMRDMQVFGGERAILPVVVDHVSSLTR